MALHRLVGLFVINIYLFICMKADNMTLGFLLHINHHNSLHYYKGLYSSFITEQSTARCSILTSCPMLFVVIEREYWRRQGQWLNITTY